MTGRGRAGAVLLSLIALACLLAAGCASISLDVGYYLHTVQGHWTVVRSARPIDEVLAADTIEPALRTKLEHVQAIRRYASRELALPDNASYTRYADLGRAFVVWNVFATPPLSLELQRWCFPVAGCVSYRGYYDLQQAERFAQQLRLQGLDVQVAGVPAYSTLGWFDDPVLNTFIHYPEGELARIVFHELAHQICYVSGDTTFNESFATTVELAGVERWLADRDDPAVEHAYRVFDARREQFVALLREHREALAAVYASPDSDDHKRQAKAAVFEQLRERYRALRAAWGGYAGYDRWFSDAHLGNAHLASVATYTAWVPGLQQLVREDAGSLPRFYETARRLAKASPAERERLVLAAAGRAQPMPPQGPGSTRGSIPAR
jgi:predicted aminopeptidase